MSVDTSMYQNIQPIDAMGSVDRGMRMRDMLDQRKLKQVEQQKQQQMDAAFNQKLSGSQFEGLGQKGYEADNAVKGQDLERLIKQTKVAGQLAGSVTDQNSYTNFLNEGYKHGLFSPGELPDQYDPGAVKAVQMRALDFGQQLDQRWKQKEFGLKERELGMKSRELGAPKETKFQEKKMEALGKKAADWSTQDRATFETNLQKTQQATQMLAKALEAGSPLFGPARGKIPDAIRRFTNEDALIVRDSMHSAIQDTLRPTLGAQFTEKEGERIMNLAINPGLSDDENMRRATALQDAIQMKIEATDALYAHIEQYGTDKGFPYEQFKMRPAGGSGNVAGRNKGGGSGSFGIDKANAAGGLPKNMPKYGQVEDGYMYKGGDPSDPSSWEKK